MTAWGAWLKPPRTLLLILSLVTLVSVSALGWFGWKLLDQERMVEAQRVQERLEQTADRLAATLRGTLAEAGERLGASAANAPDDGLLLTLQANTLTANPPNRLLYYPSPPPEPEAAPAVFAEAESLEFLQAQPQAAADEYRKLADSGNTAVRAGALVRLGRVLRRAGRDRESLTAYDRLAALRGVRVAGAPADLVARLAGSELSGSRSEAHTLRSDLLAGRWRLNRGQFQFYWQRASRLSGDAAELPADSVALSEAAWLVWQQRDDESNLRRQQTVWIGGRPYFLLWRGTPGRHFVLVARPDSILKPLIAGHGALYALTDAEGRVVAGRRSRAGRAAVRTAAESQLPWTLYVTGRPALSTAPVAAQQKFLVSAIVVMVLFLILGSYFIARAIRREMEVSRIQSDFVAAVSHEFRSPLTSIRQLSEILALGRAPSDERRQIYYETLVRESSRLQRLVEALLNFGRMEAQGRQFRFEEVDTRALVEHVVSEFEPQVVGLGRHIELHGTESRCAIQADPEAIAVALRNLVDNAVKYSPECPTVWVEWDVENEYVAIRVRDRGPGIAESERKAIFRKFVRGTAAAARNVKGSGLGLAMVQHIVAAHRGQIRLASQPGQGSTFTMLLPVTGKS